MQQLSTEMLAKALTAEFPADAACWSKATDEVRDMCREARILAEVSEEGAVDFRQISTPAQWNQQYVDGTICFYQMLSDEKQQVFCNRFEEWLVAKQTNLLRCQPAAKL